MPTNPMTEPSLPKHYQGALDFTVTERAADCVRARMKVGPGILNPFGTVHAGALIWLADVAATTLALGDTRLGPGGAGFPLAIDLHAVLLGNLREGEVIAEARFVRQGKRVSVVRTRVTSDDGRLLLELTSSHIPST
ncbi:MAG TPA: PaaI family thioesterase [Stellaceae bacterium]|nr:PaaI family thioesterase [Stellaceae bacterium]